MKRLSSPKTANEVIDLIFAKDWKDQNFKGWKYYVHLNKLFSPMEVDGQITKIGSKLGPTKKNEKIWVAIPR